MEMNCKPRIGIIMGDAAGIGPEIIVKTLSDPLIHIECEPYLLGSPHVIQAAVAMVGLDIPVTTLRESDGLAPCSPDAFKVLDCDIMKNDAFSWGTIDAVNGKNCVNAFRIGFEMVKAGLLDSLTFGPLNKESLHRGGMHHPDEAGMMKDFAQVPLVKSVVKWNQLFRCTVVGHVAFSQIIANLTQERVVLAIEHLGAVMHRYLPTNVRIGVASLNPHAGEGGDFGDEEERILKPAIEAGQRKFGYSISGPFPADTIILKALSNEIDGIVYLYHDQGNIAMKAIGFGEGVVIYTGLPIFVTTPGHGTAHNIAGKGIANAANFREALRVCIQLVKE